MDGKAIKQLTKESVRRNSNEAGVTDRNGMASLGNNEDEGPVASQRASRSCFATWRDGHNSTAQVFLPKTRTGIRPNLKFYFLAYTRGNTTGR